MENKIHLSGESHGQKIVISISQDANIDELLDQFIIIAEFLTYAPIVIKKALINKGEELKGYGYEDH